MAVYLNNMDIVKALVEKDHTIANDFDESTEHKYNLL
jgi:hypothetical protein